MDHNAEYKGLETNNEEPEKESEISYPDDKRNKKINTPEGTILREIFNTISSYLALFSTGKDKRFYITDLNSKVEEVEFIDKNEVIGKAINDTPLYNRAKLVELLNHLRITGEAHKLSVSPAGDDSEGYYMGFPLSSGNIVITWEPGYQQKRKADLSRKTFEFENLADTLPEMIYEIDLNGKVTFGNTRVLNFFGFTREDIKSGLHLSQIFPENYQKVMENLAVLKTPEDFISNEYLIRKIDGTPVPVISHSFGIFHDGKIIGYRGTVTDISMYKAYEDQIVREKAFLEHLIDSTPEAIAICDINGTITLVNKEFTNLFGYTSEEAVNRLINDLVVPDELREEAISNNKLATERYKVIRETIRKDKFGNKIQVSLIVTAITINNEPAAFVGIYRDITTEKKNALLQEVLYNISSAALKQMDLKEIYPIIVHELSRIWDTNNFFIALYDDKSETLSLPFFTDEKDNFNEIPAKTDKDVNGHIVKAIDDDGMTTFNMNKATAAWLMKHVPGKARQKRIPRL